MSFRYLRDPLFVAALFLYLLNRFFFKPFSPFSFFHNSFNDLLCIPFWVPVVLWAMRKLRLRFDDAPPRTYEIIVPLFFWSFVFEVLLPQLNLPGTPFVSDASDIFCYAIGAFAASAGWRIVYRSASTNSCAVIK